MLLRYFHISNNLFQLASLSQLSPALDVPWCSKFIKVAQLLHEFLGESPSRSSGFKAERLIGVMSSYSISSILEVNFRKFYLPMNITNLMELAKHLQHIAFYNHIETWQSTLKIGSYISKNSLCYMKLQEFPFDLKQDTNLFKVP